MDDRTYDKDSHKDRPADGAWLVTIEKRAFDALRAENERLTSELGQCVSENNQLTENAAELGKALDLALAERDAALAERDALRAELDAMRRAHSVIAARMDAMGC